MALVPQVNAWVLVGDSMLDLPIPELVPTQGVIFHEKATKQCRVLVVDPDGTHRWEELCAASPDNPIGQLYKFAGGIVTEDSLQHTLSMADDGELAVVLVAGADGESQRVDQQVDPAREDVGVGAHEAVIILLPVQRSAESVPGRKTLLQPGRFAGHLGLGERAAAGTAGHFLRSLCA
jgi:hypothetical protein